MSTIIDTRSPVPMYYQLRGILLEYIAERNLVIGDKLPSVRSLIDAYGVSLPVVRQALIELEKDGFVAVRKGKGTYIAKRPPARKEMTRNILFLFCGRDFLDPYFSKVLSGAEKEAKAERYSLIYGGEMGAPFNSHVLEREDLAGVILTGDITPETVAEMQTRNLPFVLAGDTVQDGPPGPDVNSIAGDDRRGAYLATRHLLELGHRRVAMFTGTSWMFVWRQRREGYRQALAEYGLSPEDKYLVECPFDTSDEGYRAMVRLLGQKPRPTAIFAGNDRYALGAYRLLAEKGLRVPHDFSIVGFDDLDFTREMIPSLTTVRSSMEEIGRAACKNLFAQLQTPGSPARREIVPVTLVERNSCRRLAER